MPRIGRILYVGESVVEWLDVDPVTPTFSGNALRRMQRYREFVDEGDDELEPRHIGNSLQRGTMTSSEEFARMATGSADKDHPRRNHGRPVKAEKKTGAEAPVIVDK